MRLVWAEINLDAIRFNIGQVRKKLKEGTKIMSVIKANGYGHGAARVAKEALEEESDAFGVAVLSEAIELRRKWITKPILIMGYTDWEDYEQLIAYDVMQTIYHREQAARLNEVAGQKDAVVRVHIKVDTGMHRIGFLDTPESLEEIVEIARMPHLEIHGVFSHMASADNGDEAYCRMQLDRFNRFTESLERRMVALAEARGRGVKIPVKHLANSASTLTLTGTHLDMVRPGIMLYGHFPSELLAGQDHCQLREALSLKARIVNLLHVGPGARVSYGGTFETRRNTVIATLPVGYADGIPRVLSNRGQVLVRGQKVPMIGNICMDQMMIDVTEVPGVMMGDEVVIYGGQGNQRVGIDEVARMAGTINYEILTGISERVPRVYTHDSIE